MNLIFSLIYHKKRENACFGWSMGSKAFLEMALVYELVSRIMSTNYTSYTFVP